MIQIISNRIEHFNGWKVDKISRLSEPMAFEMYDVNIIDLCDSSIWRGRESTQTKIECEKDFKSLQKMVEDFEAGKVIIAFPQNETFYYDYWPSDRKYHRECLLKDMLNELRGAILCKLLPSTIYRYDLKYENSLTCINSNEYSSAFSFNEEFPVAYRAEGSSRPTVIKPTEKICMATLNFLDTEADMSNFLQEAGFLPKKRSKYPDWMSQVVMFDDLYLCAQVDECRAKIQDLQKEMENYLFRLSENMRYKSVLCTNGDELVRDVFHILEQIFSCDLSEFVDKKKEDFRIEFDSVTLIGEIKGVTSNIKSENVSQVDVHVAGYADEQQEKGTNKLAKPILIMNPFRTKPLNQREPVHENQIRLAKRNNCLIIETITLLRIFEKFRNGELATEKIIDVFTNTSGLLLMSDFE